MKKLFFLTIPGFFMVQILSQSCAERSSKENVVLLESTAYLDQSLCDDSLEIYFRTEQIKKTVQISGNKPVDLKSQMKAEEIRFEFAEGMKAYKKFLNGKSDNDSVTKFLTKKKLTETEKKFAAAIYWNGFAMDKLDKLENEAANVGGFFCGFLPPKIYPYCSKVIYQKNDSILIQLFLENKSEFIAPVLQFENKCLFADDQYQLRISKNDLAKLWDKNTHISFYWRSQVVDLPIKISEGIK